MKETIDTTEWEKMVAVHTSNKWLIYKTEKRRNNSAKLRTIPKTLIAKWARDLNRPYLCLTGHYKKI